MTSRHEPAPGTGPPLARLMEQLAAACLVGAGAIHLAAAPVHTSHDPALGAFFWISGAAQVLLGVPLLLKDGRRLLQIAGIGSAAVVGLWIISRTVGVAGLRVPADVEAVGLADAVATGLEITVVLAALSTVVTTFGDRRPRIAAAQSSLAVMALLIGAVTAPAVLAAPHHDHEDHGAPHSHGSQVASGPHHGSSSTHADATTAHDHSSTATAAPGSVASPDHHDAGPCTPKPKEQAAADRLLAQTEAGLARLANIDVARAEGYMRYGDVAISGTWHYINWEYEADTDVLNPNKPESIVYWQATPDSPLILIGAMYIMPTVTDKGPMIGGCLTHWHTHGEPFAPAGQVTNQMLHVWLVDLPSGRFV